MANKNRPGFIIFACLLLLIPGVPGLAQSTTSDVERAFAKAIELHKAGNIDGAISAYRAILKSNPARVDIRSNLGAAYSSLGRYEEAIDEYTRALAIDTNNQTIRFNLAKAYYKAALFTETADELVRLLEATPKQSPERQAAVLLLADCQVRLGEYKKVIDLLSPLEAATPNDTAVAYLLGSALIGAGQTQRGQTLIDRVFRGEDSAQAHMLMGSILLLADDAQTGIKQLERALELDPKLPGLHAWYGRTLMRMGDPDRARVAFKTELAHNPNDFDANLYMGILLRRDRLFEESLSYLSRAIRLRPRDSYARYHVGAVYSALGKMNEAQQLLEEVVKEFPDFVEARVVLASVYYRLNRKADGDREQAVVKRLNAERQAKQPGSRDTTGSQDAAGGSQTKPPIDQ